MPPCSSECGRSRLRWDLFRTSTCSSKNVNIWHRHIDGCRHELILRNVFLYTDKETAVQQFSLNALPKLERLTNIVANQIYMCVFYCTVEEPLGYENPPNWHLYLWGKQQIHLLTLNWCTGERWHTASLFFVCFGGETEKKLGLHPKRFKSIKQIKHTWLWSTSVSQQKVWRRRSCSPHDLDKWMESKDNY